MNGDNWVRGIALDVSRARFGTPWPYLCARPVTDTEAQVRLIRFRVGGRCVAIDKSVVYAADRSTTGTGRREYEREAG